MTIKICIIGNAGSGKSTLVGDLFASLKKMGTNAELVTEYIRTDIQLNGPMKSVWEQYRTLQNQKTIEDAVPDNVDFVLIDSGTLTPFFYTALYANTEDPRQRIVVQDMFKSLTDDLFCKRYDLVFFLPRDATYSVNPNILSDGTRYQSEEDIESLERHMQMMFNGVFKYSNVITVNVPLKERTNYVLEKVMEFKRSIIKPGIL